MRAYRIGNTHVLAISEQSLGVFKVKGDLTFATINSDTLKAINFTLNNPSIQIDLKEVTTTDSAGIALMIEWLKISKQNNCTLSFSNIPLQLQTLAKISGFDQNLQLTLQTHEQSTQKVTNNTPWIN